MVVPHWADVLTLRDEVTRSDGSVGDLQMSLHKVVYQTVEVPYRDVGYYADITQPTPNLVEFFARVARRLSNGHEKYALFHLDQGMGGGKSHALVGLHHMASRPAEFFATDLGQRVKEAAEAGGDHVDLAGARIVSLTADYFSPGRPTESFGPATNLFERFLWSLTGGDRSRYDRYVGMGVNKETLQRALLEADAPVLILLDELMDYVQKLADERTIGTMPTEQAFVSDLMDACDDVDRVAFILVMIRSDDDESGYHARAQEFRDYIARRRERNGLPVAVTEPQDFAAIIRRRLFETDGTVPSTRELASAYERAAADAWREKVLDKLGSNRGLIGLGERIEATYPFHPDLMRLVREEWSKVQGFQRVRSTVAIFAKAAVYWANEHRDGRWAPMLIGVGDIPLTVALESVLGSGLLLGNDRSIQGFRAVASTDITSADASSGRAVAIDERLRKDDVDLGQPAPAVRMATSLFCYSLVVRPQGRRGAIKAELLASLLEPAAERPVVSFADAEEVFNQLVGEDGLGSLEGVSPSNAPARYWLSTVHTLRARFRAAAHQVGVDDKDALAWRTAQDLAKKGHFEKIIPVDAAREDAPLQEVFHAVDTDEVRLVILDPRRWMLHNGRDQATRADLQALFGLGSQALPVDNAASCVVACINAYKREHVRRRAGELLAWQGVLPQLPEDSEDEIREVRQKVRAAKEELDKALLGAFQHYVHLVRSDGRLDIEDHRFEDRRSSLRGEDVWADLVTTHRAVNPGGLSAEFLATLLDRFDRELTLREIRQAFYKNPEFPLVPSLDEIRRAEFDLLDIGWEIVDANGEPTGITNPERIAVNSVNLILRRRTEEPPQDGGQGEDTSGESDQQDTGGHGRTGPGTDVEERPGGETPLTYCRYRIRIPNKSITSPDDRDRAWKLVATLQRLLDPAREEYDHQLIQLDLTLTTAQGHVGDLEQRARDADARWDVEEEDF
jgi:hypothetical protein